MTAPSTEIDQAVFADERRIYLQPAGLASGHEAIALIKKGLARPLAGGSAFTSVILWWRGASGSVDRRVLSLDDLDQAIANAEGSAHDRLVHLSRRLLQAPRFFAGIALDRPRLMGVVNVTPDSFSDGNRFLDPAAAIAHGEALYQAGADFIDIGGASTRPGAEPVDAAVEIERVLPVIKGLVDLPVPLSIDTRSAEVMRAAFAAGASIINDTSALTADRLSLQTVCDMGAPVVLMHCQGEPRTMQVAPSYADAVCDVYDYLEARLAICAEYGITGDDVLIDPGIGFGKTLAHNLDILRCMTVFHGLGAGLLIGASRKSFIGALDTSAPVDRRLPGSLATAIWALRCGAHMLRVHDVAETAQAVSVWTAISIHGERQA